MRSGAFFMHTGTASTRAVSDALDAWCEEGGGWDDLNPEAQLCVYVSAARFAKVRLVPSPVQPALPVLVLVTFLEELYCAPTLTTTHTRRVQVLDCTEGAHGVFNVLLSDGKHEAWARCAPAVGNSVGAAVHGVTVADVCVRRDVVRGESVWSCVEQKYLLGESRIQLNVTDYVDVRHAVADANKVRLAWARGRWW